MPNDSKTAKRWETMPKGWTEESRKKFWGSLTGSSPKHKVTACIKKMEGKVTDPGAFCGALADRVLGTTEWRGEGRSASSLDSPVVRERLASGDAWISREEMESLCPPCAERMRRAGFRRVHASVLRRMIGAS